jgi:uncharacterized protein YigE (DUF2233 family)
MDQAKSEQTHMSKKNPTNNEWRGSLWTASARRALPRWRSVFGLFILVCLLLFLAPTFGPLRQTALAAPVNCRTVADDDSHYVVCAFDMRQNKSSAEMELFFAGADGKPYGSFSTLAEALRQRGEKLLFGMNAGMFQENLRPVGLYVEDHRMIRRVNQRSGSGNFHLKPNGIFYFGGHSAGVMATPAFIKSGLRPDYATQSGPMLVINGAIHPKIRADGTSRKIRNGVGVRNGHIVIFAISEDPVTFYRFASLFRDRLGCPNALYLDGSVSSLYAPALGRADGLRLLGPIVGIVEKATDR